MKPRRGEGAAKKRTARSDRGNDSERNRTKQVEKCCCNTGLTSDTSTGRSGFTSCPFPCVSCRLRLCTLSPPTARKRTNLILLLVYLLFWPLRCLLTPTPSPSLSAYLPRPWASSLLCRVRHRGGAAGHLTERESSNVLQVQNLSLPPLVCASSRAGREEYLDPFLHFTHFFTTMPIPCCVRSGEKKFVFLPVSLSPRQEGKRIERGSGT